MNVSPELLLNFLIAGVMIGTLYALMAMGITFIYSIMKMINWSMGEFYMLGSYAQWFLVSFFVGSGMWFIGVIASAVILFVIGLIVQWLLIRPMFSTGMERKDEYGTVVTIALAIFLRNLATVLSGPNTRAPGYRPGPHHDWWSARQRQSLCGFCGSAAHYRPSTCSLTTPGRVAPFGQVLKTGWVFRLLELDVLRIDQIAFA